MASGFLIGGGHASFAALTPAGGDASTPTESAVVYGSGCIQKVICGFDHRYYEFIENNSTVIGVETDIVDAAGIDYVEFWLNGNKVRVTAPAWSPKNTWVYGVNVKTGAGTDGDYTLYYRSVPHNGYERVGSIPITLNSNGTINRPIRYIDPTKSDSNDGLTPSTAWKTISFTAGATASLAASGVEIIAAAGTYLVDANNSTNNPNTRIITFRPADGLSATDVIISRTTRGVPTRDINLNCSIFHFKGVTIDLAKITTTGTHGLTQCRLINFDGIMGPTYSYKNDSTTELFDGLYINFTEECYIETVLYPAHFERGNTGFNSWEQMVYGSPSSHNQLGGPRRFNVDLFSPNVFQLNAFKTTTAPQTVASAIFGGVNTVVTITGSSNNNPIGGALSQAYIMMVSGTVPAKTILGVADNGSGKYRLQLDSTAGLSGQIHIRDVRGANDVCLGGNPLNDVWASISVIDATHIDLTGDSVNGQSCNFDAGNAWASGGTVFLAFNCSTQAGATQTVTIGGDKTASIQAGDTFWCSTPAHADAGQYFGALGTGIYENGVEQRVKSTGLALQPVLIQANKGSGGAVTVSGGGVAESNIVTFSSAVSLLKDAILYLTDGAQAGQGRRIAAATSSSTTATLVEPFSASQSAVHWSQLYTVKDHLRRMCVFGDTSSITVANEYGYGIVHWIERECTTTKPGLNFRNDFPVVVEASLLKNGLYQSIGVSGGGVVPAGMAVDNCQFSSGSLPSQATNSEVTAFTLNATRGPEFARPTSGVSKTMTPSITKDWSGRTIGAGATVGAQQI